MAKESGKHIKKKKRAPGSRMVMVFGGVALLYFLAQVLKTLLGFSNIETVAATHVTVDDSVTVTGCFIRNEAVIAGAKGDTVEHVVHSGEKVYTGARLAVEYADQNALEANRQINVLSDEISMMQSALQSASDLADTAKLDQLISVQMQTIAKQTHDGMVTDINDDASSLRQLVLRRVAGGQDAQTLQADIEKLQQQKQSLQSSVSAKTNVISSPCSGYFSGTVDGYENILTTDSIADMTVASFEDKLSQSPQPDETALGKVMSGFEWYFATVLPSADAEGLKPGNNYALRFAQVSQNVEVTLYAARADANSGKTLLIFKSSTISSELVSMRQQVVDIVKGTYSGIKVPKSAVRTLDNELGVYILSGSMQRFKKISKLYEGDTYFVIEQSNKADSGAVVQQDEIIVKARGLEDKKVVK